jgi:hypothetical protein
MVQETSTSPNLKVLWIVNLFFKEIIFTTFMAQIMFYNFFLNKLQETDFISYSLKNKKEVFELK